MSIRDLLWGKKRLFVSIFFFQPTKLDTVGPKTYECFETSRSSYEVRNALFLQCTILKKQVNQNRNTPQCSTFMVSFKNDVLLNHASIFC